MGIDVMIVGPAEAIASRPSDEVLNWLDNHIEDYEIRYGYIALEEDDIETLQQLAGDPVSEMLIEKANELKTRDKHAPYIIELMISARTVKSALLPRGGAT